MFEGAANLMVAGAVLIWPAMAAVAFVRVTSAWAIVTGALLLAAARRLARSHGRWLLGLAGALSASSGALAASVGPFGRERNRDDGMVARWLCARNLGFVRRSGDAVSKLDWAGDGAERLEAFAGAKDRHVAIVEHAPED